MRILLLFAFCLAPVFCQAPKSKIQAVTDTIHGVSITDPYRWLEDQEGPGTRAWIDAQMSYTTGILSKLPQRERIQRRLTELMKIDTMGAPTVRNGRYFFNKRRADQNQSVIYMREGLEGADTVLIDPNPMSKDHTTQVNLMGVSRDGRILAYGLRQGGEDETTLSFMDVETRKDLPDQFPRARYMRISMKPDRTGFYYSKIMKDGPRTYYHAMGSDPASDKLIFGEKYGPGELGSCELSTDGKWLMCQVAFGSSADKTEIFVQDLASGKPMFPVVTGLNARFDGDLEDGRLYLRTNWNAPNNRILSVDLKNPARENWKEIVPERKSVLQGFGLVGGKLVTNRLENVQTQLEILTTDGKPVRELKLPTLGVAFGPSGEWDSDEAFYSFTSFGQPTTVYRYNMSNAQQSVWSQVKMPCDAGSLE